MNKTITFSLLFVACLQTLSAQQFIENVRFSSRAEVAVEGCNDTLLLEWNAAPFENALEYTVSIEGVTTDEDIQLASNNFSLPRGTRFFSIPMIFLEDGIDENVENATIVFRRAGSTDAEFEFSFELYEEMPLDITGLDQTLCIRNYYTLTGTGAASYVWRNQQRDVIGIRRQLQYFPTSRDTIFLTGTINNCTKDTFFVPEFFEDDYQPSVEDTFFICKGNDANLSVRIDTIGGPIRWTASRPNVLSDMEGRTNRVSTDITTSVFITYTGANCVITDTIVVRVDSLPDFDFVFDTVPGPVESMPDMPCAQYCPGEVVTISSPFFRPTLYPDVRFNWTGDVPSAIVGSRTSENLFIETVDSSFYYRETTNNACRRLDTAFIPVIPKGIPTRDTIVCPNEPAQIDVLMNTDRLSQIMWTPEEGLSCTDCPEPIATVATTTTFQIIAKKDNCCLDTGTVTIAVSMPFLRLRAIPDTSVYFVGDEVNIQPITPNNVNTQTIEYMYNGEVVEDLDGLIERLRLENEGENVITATFLDNFGCEGETELILEAIVPPLRVPNAFTPNNDNTNDVFRPIFGSGPISPQLVDEFVIWARWGEEVYRYEAGEGNLPEWDGMHNGEFAPPEVYLYYLKVTLPGGREEEREGDVTLVR